MNYYIYGKTTTAVRRSRIRAESIHKIVSSITRCNFAMYLFGVMLGIDYTAWIDAAIVFNIAIMAVCNGYE